ncbi:hypothetical protein BIM11_6146 [Burkholderia pseudomallei]|nr:hypothetical protein BIM11_6146 [Burkholderia pseudomallei]
MSSMRRERGSTLTIKQRPLPTPRYARVFNLAFTACGTAHQKALEIAQGLRTAASGSVGSFLERLHELPHPTLVAKDLLDVVGDEPRKFFVYAG